MDFTIVNAENSAHGKGITKKIYQSFMDAGVDVITLGNHAFSKGEIKEVMEDCPNMVRPMNLEPKEIGKPYCIKEVCGKKLAIVNLLGEVFMDCASGSPIEAMRALLEEIEADCILVDFHAETTSEKEIFLHVFHQDICALIGTHTHVQTADERVFNGCAYISDVGMCGVYDSILGRSVEEVLRRNVGHEVTHFTPAEGPSILCGCLIQIDEKTGRATNIFRIQERPEI